MFEISPSCNGNQPGDSQHIFDLSQTNFTVHIIHKIAAMIRIAPCIKVGINNTLVGGHECAVFIIEIRVANSGGVTARTAINIEYNGITSGRVLSKRLRNYENDIDI